MARLAERALIMSEREVEAFYDAHQEKVLGYVRGMGIGYHDAEDIVNTCFEVIWRYWEKLGDGKARAFLYTVARNEVYKRSRRRYRRREDLMAEPLALATGDFAQQVVDRVALRRALDPLPEREREAVLLRYYVGCDVAETARIMGGIGCGSVKRYAFDGRRKLLDALTEDSKTRKAGAQ